MTGRMDLIGSVASLAAVVTAFLCAFWQNTAGQPINIRGHLYDGVTGIPMAGATAQLLTRHNAAITDSSGYFRITENSAAVFRRQLHAEPDFRLNGTMLAFTVPTGAELPISIRAYDAAGRNRLIFTGKAAAGRHALNLDGRLPAPGIYRLRISLAGRPLARTLSFAPDGVFSTSNRSETPRAAVKRAAPLVDWDTLVVTKAGYHPLRLPLATPVDSIVKISLQPGAQPNLFALVVAAGAAPRVAYGAEVLAAALQRAGYQVVRAAQLSGVTAGTPIVVANLQKNQTLRQLVDQQGLLWGVTLGGEGFLLASLADGTWVVAGNDDSGTYYGSLELRDRIQSLGRMPPPLRVAETPAFRLRGPCIGMQKVEILPGRDTYEYPYTPENFPFFYDKDHWLEYLDFLGDIRMNTLTLWNGHPFASLVKLDDYPYAVEVPEDVFQRNVEMFHFITEEADKRGIWVIQMFYNIFVSKPFAEENGIGTQHGSSNSLIADYNRRSIAKFVEQYPNVGLLVCLGEALSGMDNQKQWLNEVVLPGVKDGMAALGVTEEPPVVIRAHAVDSPAEVIASALPQYKNLYTMAKYNGESLTTYQPRGSWAQLNVDMSATGGTHVSNVHILANLEPFRYGAQDFIRKCVIAQRDRHSAQGLHLYPLSYWNWPVSPDKVQPPLVQYDRDWIWFESWARYAWDPDRDPVMEKTYWTARLARVYGNLQAGAKILEAYNAAGECAPQLLRRFGITEGNRQTFSLGMTLDQLVNPSKYREWPDLWNSQAPLGERLDTWADREMKGQPHQGETPPSVVAAVDGFSKQAVDAIEAAAPLVTKNNEEFERLRNDMHCIRALSLFYIEKVKAAMAVLLKDERAGLSHLEASLEHYRELERLTRDTYHFANSMQTSHRKIPTNGPGDYHWSQLLPVYEEELEDFRSGLN